MDKENKIITKVQLIISDADIIGSRVKRSPVFPGYDVFQLKAFKAAKKLKKKKVKKLIKASPFLAAKAVKKKVKVGICNFL